MINLFLFFSLLAASMDGFISGLLISGIGIKLDFNGFVKTTGIIFSCCMLASMAGNTLSGNILNRYINIAGACVMMFLALKALKSRQEHNSKNSITAVAFSVAADAAIVCIYLAACGYSTVHISLCAALMHSLLMVSGQRAADLFIVERRKTQAGYISAVIFMIMAVYKIYHSII